MASDDQPPSAPANEASPVRPGPTYDGPDRRGAPGDRRSTSRGGRRATDFMGKIATFVHKLLTAPPE